MKHNLVVFAAAYALLLMACKPADVPTEPAETATQKLDKVDAGAEATAPTTADAGKLKDKPADAGKAEKAEKAEKAKPAEKK